MATNRIFTKYTTMRNPHTNQVVEFRPGQILPSWADSEHLNPDLFGEAPKGLEEDYELWTNPQLNDELVRRGLSSKGRKADKINRLEVWDEREAEIHAASRDPFFSIQVIDPLNQPTPDEDEDEDEDEEEPEEEEEPDAEEEDEEDDEDDADTDEDEDEETS